MELMLAGLGGSNNDYDDNHDGCHNSYNNFHLHVFPELLLAHSLSRQVKLLSSFLEIFIKRHSSFGLNFFG